MSGSTETSPGLPLRWLVRIAWIAHRAIYRLTGGRRGLGTLKPGGWRAMRLTTVGRRTGSARGAIQDHPEATVVLKSGVPRAVRAHAAVGEERDRLWAKWRETDKGLDGDASRRPAETAVAVLGRLE